MQPWKIPLESIAFPEANHVKPMPSPALPISRGLQKFIDQQPISLIAWIALESLKLFEARRQSDQVIEDPSQKGPGRCPRIGLQSTQAKFRQNIRIDHISHGPTSLDIGLNLTDSDRQWTRSKLSKRPPIVSGAIVRADPEPIDRLGGQASPLRDPFAQELFFPLSQLDLRGHLIGRNNLPELAGLPGLSQNIAGIRTPLQPTAGRQVQSAGRLALAMAFKATARQQRNDRGVGLLVTLLDGFLVGLLGKESTRKESNR